jgi:hypothetical protein
MGLFKSIIDALFPEPTEEELEYQRLMAPLQAAYRCRACGKLPQKPKTTQAFWSGAITVDWSQPGDLIQCNGCYSWVCEGCSNWGVCHACAEEHNSSSLFR